MRRKIATTILISIMIILTVFMEVGAVAVNQPVQTVNVIQNANTTGNEVNKEVEDAQNTTANNIEVNSSQEETPEDEEENEVAPVNEDETEALEEEKVTEDTENEETEESKEEEKEEESKETEEVEEVEEDGEDGEEEYITEEDLIYSNKYLVKGNNILRIDPKTSIEEFNKNIEVAEGKEIKIYKGKEEVTSGYIGTGMIVKGDEGEEYTISVIGDITGDGIANQVELTRIIRYIVGLEEWKLEGIERESADITGDGEVNLVDISKLINYIVYGTWDYEVVKAPEAPIIEVISEKEENTDYYIEKVEIKIETEEYEKGGRTIYKITGDKEQEETEIKEGEIITIEGEGEYLITAYSYGKEGNKSRVANRRITIKDKYTVIYSPGEEGLFSEQKTEGIKYGEETPEFEGNIKGTPGYMFIGWEPEVEEKVTKSVTYTAQWKKVEYTIDFGTNGGNFTMPTEGDATISTEITETDTEGNDKYTLEYVWSKDGEKAPEEGWEEFTNGDEIKKEDITEPGTWYVWVKVTDEDGNVVEIIRSDPFIITGNDDEANQIKLTTDKTEWTNEDVKVTIEYGDNLTGDKKIEIDGEEGTDYEIDEDGSIIIKTNGTTITVEAEDEAGNKIVEILKIDWIDKVLPTVTLSPNGGESYTMPSIGNAKISSILTAEDPEETEESGQSGLKTLQYAWSQSNTEEPENWIKFANEEKVEKADIKEPGTWYLWTKVIDNAGNRAEEIKVSNPFKITANTDEANKITLTPNNTDWTNQDVEITIKYGENLSENKTITCTGEEGTDYEIIGDNKIIIKTNDKEVTVTAEDEAGNKIVATLKIDWIDKLLPIVTLSPNGANLTMPSIGTAKINTTITAEDPAKTEANGSSGIKTMQYAWSQSNTEEPEEWTNFTSGQKIEKTGITEAETWYLWTKVIDNAENRAEEIKISNPFKITGNDSEANQIILTPNKTDWTNEDVIVTVEFGANITENRTLICEGTEGIDYEVNGEEEIIVKTNQRTVIVIGEDKSGNRIVKTLTIANIDKLKPTVSLSPNGGTKYVMPTTGNGKISTTIIAEEMEKTETNGKSELNTLQYAWSQSSTEEPVEWTDFTNGSKIEKTDIEEPGTWYLWTKVTDHAGNRAEEIKISDPFIIGSSEDEANRITLAPDKTEWTNEDVTVTVKYGENLTGEKKVEIEGTEGTDYEIDEEGNIIIKTNGTTITVTAEDIEGNKIVETLKIDWIDKLLPTVSLSPNGGNYTMPTTGDAKLNTTITAKDTEATEESGQSGLNTLEYAWSQSNTEEPAEWENFTNNSKVEKTGITEPGTWYLWTKVIDNAGNRAEEIKVSNPFKITANTDEANKITLTPDKTDWTNQDVEITINYGENLSENKTITCTGEEGIDYEIIGDNKIIIKTNDKEVTVTAEDEAGNKIEITLKIDWIDKLLPTVSLSPNGGNYTMPTTGDAKLNTTITAKDTEATEAYGQSGLNTLEYAWSQSKTEEPSNWETFTNGSKIEKTGITEPGTWYLWTKVTDNAGNRAEEIKISNPFIITTNENEANRITLIPDITTWTNQDVTVAIIYGENLTQNKTTACEGTEGTDYTKTGVEKIVVKTNHKVITATAEDEAGNKIVATLNIENIDKLLPTVSLNPNGGNYTMPTTGDAKLNTTITAKDTEATETYGQSGLNTLTYAWSQSSTEEPSNWTNFTNNSKVEKTGITEPGTWYLWTKVTDNAGNRAEQTKVSNPFKITSNTDEANRITLIPDITTWTNQDVTVEINYGENLSGNKTITCTGEEGTDYEIIGDNQIIIKTNDKIITVTAEDEAGNKIVVTLNIKNIDKLIPTVSLSPNGGNYTMPTTGNAKLNTTITAKDTEETESSGQSGLNTLEYAWSQSSTQEPSNWTNFTNGSKVEKTGITSAGTWYLWTKVTDNAGNRAEQIKVSNPFKITSNTDPANQITFIPDPSNWTNTNVNVTINYGANLIGEKTVTCTGTKGTDYTINETTSVVIKNNNKEITATAEDGAGNKIVATQTIANIDRLEPKVMLLPNGGNDYSMPRTGYATIKTYLVANDEAQTQTDGKSDLNILQYAWSQSRTEEPTEWKNFENNQQVIKDDIAEAGIWYLWTKVIDNAGNRAEETKVSNPFIISSTQEIKLTASETEWTNKDVIVTATYSENIKTKSLTCLRLSGVVTTGEKEGIDFVINGTESVTVKSNELFVLASGVDAAGNTTEAILYVGNIDKQAPVVTLSQDGGNFTMPTTGNAKINTTLTAVDPVTETSGACGIQTLQYAWSTSNTVAPTSWTNFTSGQFIEKTGITGPAVWYLWTKAIDDIGNEDTHPSKAFTITANTDPANQITFTPTPSSWTNQDVTVAVSYGENLIGDKTLGCTGTSGTDYTVSGTSKVIVITNNKEITATAQDGAGNVITKKLTVDWIDKVAPTVSATVPTTWTTGNKTITVSGTDDASGIAGYYVGTTSTKPSATASGWSTATTYSKGVGTYYIWSKDNAGNISAVKQIEVTNIDTTAPVIELSANSNTTWAASRTVTVTLKDEESGLATGAIVKYGWSTSNTTAPTSYTNVTISNYTAGATSATFEASISTSGKYYLWVVPTTLKNVAGGSQTSNKISTGTFYIDSTKPTITVSPASSDYATSTEVTITVADEGGSGLSSSNSLQYYLSTSSTALAGGSWTTYTSGTKFTIGTGKTGTFYLFVKRVNDVAGNTSTSGGTSTTIGTTTYQRFGAYKFDNTAPTAGTLTMKLGSSTGSDYSSDTWTNSSVYISPVNGSDADSGHKSTVYSVSGTTTLNNQTSATTLTATGTYTVKVVTTDNVGKTAERSYTIKIDKALPTAELTATTESWTSNNVTLSGKASDSDSGIAGYQFSTSSTTPTTGWVTTSLTSQPFTKTLTSSGTWYLYVKDNAGNVKQSNSITAQIDKTAPTITVSPTSSSYATSTKITIKAEDTGGSGLSSSNSYQYYLSTSDTALTGGSWATYTSSGSEITIGTSKTGTYYLFVKRVNDVAGNTSSSGGTSTTVGTTTYQVFGPYKFDNTAPTVTLTAASTTGWVKEAEITGKAKDSNSGIVAYQFSQTSNLTASSSGWTAITATTSEISQIKKADANGTWYFYVKDAAGNVNKASVTVSVDSEPPTITSALKATDQTIQTISLSVKAQDSLSGFYSITWYYRIHGSGDNYVLYNIDEFSNSTFELTLTKNISPLEPATQYDIKIILRDAAGNERESEITASTAAVWRNETTKAQYGNLQSAISEASTGQTLTLLESYKSDTSTPVVNAGKSITINTNTNTVQLQNSITVSAGCSLTVTGGGSITIFKLATNGITSITGPVVYNYGELFINGCNLLIAGNSADNPVICNEGAGSITMTDGEIGVVYNINSPYGISSAIEHYSSGKITITGGKVNTGANNYGTAISVLGSGVLEIGTSSGSTGPTIGDYKFTSSGYQLTQLSGNILINYINAKVYIYSGRIGGTVTIKKGSLTTGSAADIEYIDDQR